MKDTEKIEAIQKWLGAGTINIFGRPFAGKDTHGRELVALFGGTLLGGGDILRNSVIPEHIEQQMRAGKLVTTDDYIDIVLPFLSKQEFAGKPLILSSVGRWHGEEQGVLEATEESGHPTKAVIYLDLDEANVHERWRATSHLGERGDRHDDTEAILDTRLEEYREKTIPVIEYYRQSGLLVEIDSSLTKEAALQAILDELFTLSQT